MSDENTSPEDVNSAIANEQATQTGESGAEANTQAAGEQGQDGQQGPQEGQEGQTEGDGLKEGSRAHQRVQQALRDRNAAIGYAERTAARVAELEQQLAAKPALRPEQYRSDEEFIRATADDAAQRASVQLLKRQAEDAAIQAQRASQEAWTERTADMRARTPDFDAVAHNPQLTITPVMADAIRESELGGELAYYLGKNPAEASRIASLPPVSQAVTIARLEARVAKPQAKSTQAPAPIAPLKPKGGGGAKSLEDMSFEEYRKARGF
jgi:hypothetical protein